MIVAGAHTMAMTLTYLTYAVLSNETVKQRHVAEVSMLSGDLRRDYLPIVRNLPYLNNVFLEH